VEMNGEPGGKYREVKVNAGETGQTEGDAEKIQFFHRRRIIDGVSGKVTHTML